jgi:hypothetical protein
MSKEAKDSQPVVDRHQHYALAGKVLAVIGVSSSAAAGEAAAMNPYHHGKAVFRRFGRSPDIQVQAVFAEWWEFRLVYRTRRVLSLPAGFAELFGFAHAWPRRRRLRRLPAEIAHRRRGERNTAVDADVGIFPGAPGEQSLLNAHGIRRSGDNQRSDDQAAEKSQEGTLYGQ